jgi:hypothetical protein
MLMFQPVGLIYKGPVATANTACFLTRWLRGRCLGHRVQEMASLRTTTAMPGRTPRVCWQLMGNKRARRGNHQQFFLQKSTRDEHPRPGRPRSTRRLVVGTAHRGS